MAKGGGGGGIPDVLLYGGVAVGLYLAWKEGMLTEPIAAGQKLVDELFSKLENAPGLAKLKGGGTAAQEEGTGGGISSAGSTGSCAKTIYPATGQTLQAKPSGVKTRHYASGKPDDKTMEWNTKTNLESYEVTWYGNIGKPDHDDTISMKLLGGTHEDGKGAWHIYDLTFKQGKAIMGFEKPHPDTTNDCGIKGKSVGSIENKNIGIKAVIWPIGGGHHVEGWADTTGTWQKLIEANNPCGKKFSLDSRGQQVQVRIDAAPKAKSSCCVVQAIKPPSTSFTNAFARAYPSYVSPLAPEEIRQRHKECGFVCALEQTRISELAMIQRGFKR